MKRISQNKFYALSFKKHTNLVSFSSVAKFAKPKSLSVGFAKQLECLINSCKKPKFFVQKSS